MHAIKTDIFILNISVFFVCLFLLFRALQQSQNTEWYVLRPYRWLKPTYRVDKKVNISSSLMGTYRVFPFWKNILKHNFNYVAQSRRKIIATRL